MNILPILNTATFGTTPEPVTINGITYSMHTPPSSSGTTVKDEVAATMGRIGAVVHLHRRRTAVTNIIALDPDMHVRYSKLIATIATTADISTVRRDITEHTFTGAAELLGVSDWRLIADDHTYDLLHMWIGETLNRGAF